MTHQPHVLSSSSTSSAPPEESKDSLLHPSTSSTQPSPPDEPPQCSVYFDPKEWSRRYASTFFTASVTSFTCTDSTPTYRLHLRCVDDSWDVDHPFSHFERLLQEVRGSQRGEGWPVLPPKTWVPTQEGWVEERQGQLQAFLNALLQRRDVCRVRTVREFLALDTPLTVEAEMEDEDGVEETEMGKEAEGV